MQKKTALRTTSRRKVSRASHSSGLTVNQQTLKRSVRTKSALDNRSHRTPELTRERTHKMRRRSRRFHSSLVGFNDRYAASATTACPLPGPLARPVWRTALRV